MAKEIRNGKRTQKSTNEKGNYSIWEVKMGKERKSKRTNQNFKQSKWKIEMEMKERM